MKEYTFIIKTYERLYCVIRLVRSLRKHYHDSPIIIGDDSKIKCSAFFFVYAKVMKMDIRVIELPYNCGLSYGRNELVKNVKTDYFVLLDDDFVIDEKCDIASALDLLRKEKLDIIGGYFRNYKVVRSVVDIFRVFVQAIKKDEKNENYCGKYHFDENRKILRVKLEQSIFPDFMRTEVVENFFIARTETIRDGCLWENELKLNEHIPFFFEAKNKGLNIAFTNKLSVMHKPIRFKKYATFRMTRYYQVFMNKKDIREVIWEYDNGKIDHRYNIKHYSQGRRVYLFGAGKNCRELLSYGNNEFSGIIDNDPNKQSDVLYGVKIISPTNIVDWNQVYVIITVSNSKNIEEQLAEYGLKHITDYLLINEF